MNWVLHNYVLDLPGWVVPGVLVATVLAAAVRYGQLARGGASDPLLLVLVEAALLLTALTVLALTLDPRDGGGRARQIDPYFTGRRVHVGHPERRMAESLANLAMLVPLGLLAGLRWPSLLRGRRALAFVGLVPIVPELLQYAFPIGRVAALEDVELGVCGTAFGLAVGGVVGGAALTRRRARTLASWTCSSCPSDSATICLIDSCPMRTDSPSSAPSMPRSRREPAHRR